MRLHFCPQDKPHGPPVRGQTRLSSATIQAVLQEAKRRPENEFCTVYAGGITPLHRQRGTCSLGQVGSG